MSAPQNSILRARGATHVNVIMDQFNTLAEVSKAVRNAGLESSNLIFGIDYTASNKKQGAATFGGKSLHDIAKGCFNPYQKVMAILGETLEPFDEDGVIPAYGFGDKTTKDQFVFPLKREGFCEGFHEVLNVYNDITPTVSLNGPTNFAPLIHQAIEIVRRTMEFHILVIVADGQVNRKQPTVDAIVAASKVPLSIVMVGVGDGPWDMMEEFDDKLPSRAFDNFQFVNYQQVVTKHTSNSEAAFALHALMEIPDQYKEIKRLGLLNLSHT